MKLKLKDEETFVACVIAFDHLNRATPAYRALQDAARPYKQSPAYRVTETYAKEFNYFGYQVCEVCTLIITKII